MELAVRLPAVGELEGSVLSLLETAADAGFEGVLFGGLEELQLRAVAEAVGETGLTPVAAHVSLDRLQVERTAVVRELRTVGCERVVVPALHAAHFERDGEVARMATRLSALGGRLAADGRTLCYHNRAHEFRELAGGDAYDLLVSRAGEGLAFEFDAGWATVAGRDPVSVLEDGSARVPLVDVTPRVPETGERRLPGKGALDLPAVAAAARRADVRWLVHAAAEPPVHAAELEAAADVLRSVRQ